MGGRGDFKWDVKHCITSSRVGGCEWKKHRRKRVPRRPQGDENDAEDGAPGTEVHEAVREI